MVSSLVSLLIFVLILGLVIWVAYWIIGLIGVPEPFGKIAIAILAIIGLIILLERALPLLT